MNGEMNNSSSHFPFQNPTHTTQTQGNEEQQPPPSDDNTDDDHQEKARCEWNFNLSAVISSSTSASDAVGSIEFDHSNSLLATGGLARKIRIYRAEKLNFSRENDNNNIVSYLDHSAACEFYICTPARLSSLKWKPGSGSRVIGSGDYDGLVMEHDLETRVPVFERDEHGGRRVWAVDYSGPDPALGASGSDDGTMQMWDTRCEPGRCAGLISPNPSARSPVCSVEFGPSRVVAVGCADRSVYGYDTRRLAAGPVFVLDGHERAVTYARFLDAQTIVSASVDGRMVMWDVGDRSPIRVFKGHVNSTRFVGLSVWRRGGLLSCGSEDNKVFVYDMRWGDPIWARGFEPMGRGFVSGVCWRQTEEERCVLVAGGSDGVLQVFQGERKSTTGMT